VIEWAEIGRQIEARERVARMHDAMAAAGTMAKDPRRKHMNALDHATRLQKVTVHRSVPKPGGPLSPADAAIRAQGRAILAGMGIPIVKAGSDG
jgi:hypothetical protein